MILKVTDNQYGRLS